MKYLVLRPQHSLIVNKKRKDAEYTVNKIICVVPGADYRFSKSSFFKVIGKYITSDDHSGLKDSPNILVRQSSALTF